MKHSKLLLPHGLKPVGIVLFIIGSILLIGYGLFDLQFSWNDIRQLFGLDKIETSAVSIAESMHCADSDLCYTIAGLLIVLGGLMTGFSRCKHEDEFIEQIRYEALVVTMYISGIAIIGVLLFTWGLGFMVASVIYIYFSIVFFLIYFHIKVALVQRKVSHEE